MVSFWINCQKQGIVTTADLTSVAQNMLKMEMVIKNMIEANILRYCVDGAIKISW